MSRKKYDLTRVLHLAPDFQPLYTGLPLRCQFFSATLERLVLNCYLSIWYPRFISAYIEQLRLNAFHARGIR
jgi:hypothetical protein